MKKQPLPGNLIRSARLESVRLTKMLAETSIRTTEEVGTPSLHVAYGGKVATKSDGGFSALVRAEANVKDDATPTAPAAVRIILEYELAYAVPDDVNASDDELAAFSHSNAILNAWPYLRETIHSCSVKMGLPPLLLPLFRLTAPAEARPAEPGSQRAKHARKAAS